MIDPNELERLSKAATQGEWKISAYYTGTGPDEKCHGLVVVEDFPIGIIDEEGATAESLSPNLEFVTTLVNAYRTSQLAPFQQPSGDVVEAVAKANLECLEMSEKLQDAEDEIRLLTKALHDAINAPKGVVPASAEAFYQPALASDPLLDRQGE